MLSGFGLYSEEHEAFRRTVRHARLGPIGGGTSDIMNEVIAKQLGL